MTFVVEQRRKTNITEPCLIFVQVVTSLVLSVLTAVMNTSLLIALLIAAFQLSSVVRRCLDDLFTVYTFMVATLQLDRFS